MGGSRRKELRQFVLAGLLVAIAYACRLPNMLDLPPSPFFRWIRYARSVIFILLIALWGVSVHRRILHSQVHRYLAAIACLMLFWLLVRTIKFDFARDPVLAHWLWYLYYLPDIWIPLLTLYVSVAICRSEDYRIPRSVRLLYIPALILLALVLTNDLHNMVFILPADDPLTSENGAYGYGFGYYAITGWWVLCYLASVASLFVRNRLPNKNYRILIPVGIMTLLGLYVIFYWLWPPWIRLLFNDFSVVFCVLLTAFFESLLQLGLIQNNAHYVELFRCAGLPAVIVDGDRVEAARTAAYRSLPPETMRRAESASIVMESGVRLSSAPIRRGRVLWQEDLSELLELNRRLDAIRLEIEEQNAAEVEAYKADALRRQLAERNRLYDMLQIETQSRVERLSALLDELERAATPEEERALLLRISVIGAYIKRRNNLSFISESRKDISPRELYYCMEQSIDCLTMFGVEAEQSFRLTEDLPIERIIRFYEAFEEAVERSLDTLSELFLSLTETESGITMNIFLCTEADLSALAAGGLTAKNEGGEWMLSISVQKGGEPV